MRIKENALWAAILATALLGGGCIFGSTPGEFVGTDSDVGHDLDADGDSDTDANDPLDGDSDTDDTVDIDSDTDASDVEAIQRHVTILSPDEDFTANRLVSSVEFTVQASGADSDGVELIWTIDRDGDQQVSSGPLTNPNGDVYTHEWEVGGREDGVYTFVARLFDGTGALKVSDPVTITVNHTPPAIVSRSPENDEENVSILWDIVVEFSEEMDAARVMDGVTLKDEGDDITDSVAWTMDEAARVLTGVFSQDAEIPTGNMTLLITGATDLAGNPLDAEEWSWTAPPWLRVGTILSNLASVPDPSLVLDDNGNPIVYWVNNDESPRTLHIFQRQGDEWIDRSIAGGGPNYHDGRRELSVAVAGDTLHAAWLTGAFHLGRIRYATQQEAGEDWNVSELVGDPANLYNLSLGHDGQGQVFLNVSQDQGVGQGTSTWGLDPQGNWVPLSGLVTQGSVSFAVSSDSRPVIAFTTATGDVRVFYWPIDGATTWEEFSMAGVADSEPSVKVGLAMDGNAAPYLALFEGDQATGMSVRLHSLANDEWTQMGTYEDVQLPPTLALTPNNQPILAWSEGAPAMLKVWMMASAENWRSLSGDALNATFGASRSGAIPMVIDPAGKPVLLIVHSENASQWAFDVVRYNR